MNSIILTDTNMEIVMNEDYSINSEEKANNSIRSGKMKSMRKNNKMLNTVKNIVILGITVVLLTLFTVNTVNSLNSVNSAVSNIGTSLTV